MLNMKKKNNNAVAKSDKEELITALDIGSSHLRLLSGYVGPDKQIRIRGYKEIKSVGYSNGEINDIGKLASSIASIVQQFQNEYGIEVKDVVTGVPGHVIQGENQQGNITVSSGQVTETDRNRAIENAAAGLQQLNRNDFVVIHKNPQNYSTESSENIVNPIGFYAKRLDVNVHFIGCKGLYKKNIEQAVSMISSNIHTKNVIYVGNAVSAAAITENEKEIGVIQADIGGGTISFTVYDAGKQLISQGISDGGDYITNSIAREFAIPKQSAEELKLKYGIASPDIIPDDQKNYQLKVEVPTQFSNQTEEVTITLGELSAVIYRCLGSMFELLFQRITSHGKSFLKSLDIGAGVVLTGGTAMLRGIDTVLSDYINYYTQNPANEFLHCNSKVRIGVPVGLRMCDDIRIPNELRSSMAPGIAARPDQAVVFGLLRVAKFDNLEQYSNSRSRNDDSDEVGKGFLGNFKNWMKREL
ncbi:MAG: cell division protein FtsA [Succinatimonas sp.]|nr:cell division protein FtsA [Succinatimonas sp.]MCI7025025.1 cell division protein FtsA [Succinatimonas sp.]MDD6755373.1 cell division protein FtsA [Succinatimonas sp.]MDY6246073.1 cell division protein FtsA [Succinivibrio sp.]MDY6260642.1 cell division protein FtsA [Succinivibrio sp.]